MDAILTLVKQRMSCHLSLTYLELTVKKLAQNRMPSRKGKPSNRLSVNPKTMYGYFMRTDTALPISMIEITVLNFVLK